MGCSLRLPRFIGDKMGKRASVSILPNSRLNPLAKEKAAIISHIEQLTQGRIAASITFIIDGGGAVITTGEKGHLVIPFNAFIREAIVLADQSGSTVVDIWKDTYGNFPPVNADSITGATPPTLSTAQASRDTSLVDWKRHISKGDVLAFNVDSATTVTRVSVILEVQRD